jgi:hypothetical protein
MSWKDQELVSSLPERRKGINMNQLNKTNLLCKLLLKIPRGKAQQGDERNPASSVNPDRTLCVRLGSLRWLTFSSPVGLACPWTYTPEKFSEIEPENIDDLSEKELPEMEESRHECEDGCSIC